MTVLLRVVAILSTAQIMRSPDSLLWVCVTFMVVLIAVQVVRRRACHAASAEVRVDRPHTTRPTRLDIGWVTLGSVVFITGGLGLTTIAGVDPATRALTIAAVGGWAVGGWVVLAATGTGRSQDHWVRRYSLPTLVDGISWTIIGVTVDPGTGMTTALSLAATTLIAAVVTTLVLHIVPLVLATR
jgi:hypothetical protein